MADKKTLQKRESDKLEKVERTRDRKVFAPAVDIYETNEAIILVAEMPGVDEKTIDVTLDNDVLTLRGQVNYDIPEGYELVYNEYDLGDYERSFTVNEYIDVDKIEAEYHNGVLTVTLPKAEPVKAKKVQVKVK
ncbi:Hsp20/alpha crystallin family protein [Calditrichota bacterium LG25]|uniref:Heat shock protein Hsp20 n=1 Tax=Caldithrix abyssi DSM 13497 TaxID=880073 RepID=H1XYV2_CALAY|nr:Hsp20/alpha crystallin family protein [Caldithrix abyssi]APF20507.1 Molecular chaperone IbpA, HSP20 family [Caldithrix abyssi DSM 13497]EHO40971.1 heat shock protein Hsp20 [Caldithrix abyssi DSM 13497]